MKQVSIVGWDCGMKKKSLMVQDETCDNWSFFSFNVATQIGETLFKWSGELLKNKLVNVSGKLSSWLNNLWVPLFVSKGVSEHMVVSKRSGSYVERDNNVNCVMFMCCQDEERPEEVQRPAQSLNELQFCRSIWKRGGVICMIIAG